MDPITEKLMKMNALHAIDKKEIKEFVDVYDQLGKSKKNFQEKQSKHTQLLTSSKKDLLSLFSKSSIECVDVTNFLPMALKNDFENKKSLTGKRARDSKGEADDSVANASKKPKTKAAPKQKPFHCFLRKRITNTVTDWNEALINKWTTSWTTDNLQQLEFMRYYRQTEPENKQLNKLIAERFVDTCKTAATITRPTIALTTSAPRKSKNETPIVGFRQLDSVVQKTVETWLTSKVAIDENKKTLKPAIKFLEERYERLRGTMNNVMNTIASKDVNTKSADVNAKNTTLHDISLVFENTATNATSATSASTASASTSSFAAAAPLSGSSLIQSKDGVNDGDDNTNESDSDDTAETAANYNYHLVQKTSTKSSPVTPKDMIHILHSAADNLPKQLQDLKRARDFAVVKPYLVLPAAQEDELKQAWQKCILEAFYKFKERNRHQVNVTSVCKRAKKMEKDDS